MTLTPALSLREREILFRQMIFRGLHPCALAISGSFSLREKVRMRVQTNVRLDTLF